MADRRDISDDERSELVAFLDGELTGEAARAVERKLSLDPRMRAEADSLKRTYDLLDFLPKPPEPSPAFTERTLSKLEPMRANPERPSRSGWLGFGLGWAAALLVAAAGGYAGYTALAPRGPGERELVRDLRLIENKRHYERVEDFEYLEQLADPDLFGE